MERTFLNTCNIGANKRRLSWCQADHPSARVFSSRYQRSVAFSQRGLGLKD